MQVLCVSVSTSAKGGKWWVGKREKGEERDDSKQFAGSVYLSNY